MTSIVADTSEKTPRAVASRRRHRTPPDRLLHGDTDVMGVIGSRTMAAVFPTSAGLLLYGWRAAGALALIVGSAFLAASIWRRIGARGAHLRYDHSVWLALMLGLTLPAHLFQLGGTTKTWPILVAGGMLVVIFAWLFGGIGAERLHPVAITHLLLFVFFSEILMPHSVLQRNHLFFGDVLRAAPVNARAATNMADQPWIDAANVNSSDALMTPGPLAPNTLSAYTSAAARSTAAAGKAGLSLDGLLRDRLPPLQDLIIGGHPGPLGTASTIATLIGGLFLLYRGLIDYRVPLLIILCAAAAMLVLPIPILIREDGVVRQWLAIRSPDVGWPAGLTLVNYELVAGPLVFVAFFLATSPAVRPIVRRRRVIYAIALGLFAGIFQLYVSVAIGPYLALLAASLLTPTLDRLFTARTIV